MPEIHVALQGVHETVVQLLVVTKDALGHAHKCDPPRLLVEDVKRTQDTVYRRKVPVNPCPKNRPRTRQATVAVHAPLMKASRENASNLATGTDPPNYAGDVVKAVAVVGEEHPRGEERAIA